MADSKIRIAAVGSKSEGINEINPRFQAEALRNIRGIDCGVLDNSFYSEDVDPYGVTKTANPDSFMFPIDISSYTVSIGRGMATAYGYDFQTEEAIQITTLEDGTPLSQLSPGTATYYLFVYLEWNLAANPAEGSIKIHNNGTASIWRSLVTENSSNNLIRIPSGTYKLPIWRLTCTSTGLGNALSWEDMNLCPTIKRPQAATSAECAETRPQGDGSDRVATCAYVDRQSDTNIQLFESVFQDFANQINNDVLNFSESTFEVAGVATATIKRLCGFVICECNIESDTRLTTDDFSSLASLGTVPEGFRPLTDTPCQCIMKTDDSNNGGAAGRFFRCKISASDGKINVLYSDWYGGVVWNIYDVYMTFGYQIHSPTLDVPEFWDKHSLILNYDSSKVCATAPTYYEIGTPFTLKAIATGYCEECVIDVTGGSISGGADGEYTVTPTSTSCEIVISVRYFEGGIDESGYDGVSEPDVPEKEYTHTIRLWFSASDVWGGNIITDIMFSFTNKTAEAYTTFSDVVAAARAVYGTSNIFASGTVYSTASSSYNYIIDTVRITTNNEIEVMYSGMPLVTLDSSMGVEVTDIVTEVQT